MASKRVASDPAEFKITRKLVESRKPGRSLRYHLFLNGKPVGHVSEYTTLIAGGGSVVRTRKAREYFTYINLSAVSSAVGVDLPECTFRRSMYNPTGPRLTEALRKAIAATQKGGG